MVHRELKVLICLTCRHALNPTAKAVVSHFNSNHCMKGETIQKLYPGLSDRLHQTLDCSSFALPKDVREQPPDQAPISGIQVKRGFYCPMKKSDGKPCAYVGGTTATIETHINCEHKGVKNRPSVDTLKQYSCDYQSLFTGNLRHAFRVRTGMTGIESHPDGANNPYSVFMRQMESMQPTDYRPEPMKYEELPSFLRATRWNVCLEPYRSNPKDIVSLVQYPSVRALKDAGKDGAFERLLCRLPDVSTAWIDQVYRYWRASSDYSQRVLAQYPM